MTLAEATPEPLALDDVGAIAAGPCDSPETLLYLHGWGAGKELWWNALHDLADVTRGIAVDLPGTGGTPLGTEMTTMPEFARWVAATCGKLGLNSITLVGHSLGGNLAAQVALDYPDLVRRLVLVDAALETGSLPRRAQWPLSPRYGLTSLRLTRFASLAFGAAGAYVPDRHSGGYWLPYARRTHLYVTANSVEALQQQLQALCANPLHASRLRAITAPILIVHGAHDEIIPLSRARSLAASLPGSRISVFETGDHCPMDDDPPGFALVLRDFCLRDASAACDLL